MLAVISPAKKLDMDVVTGLPRTEPAFKDETNALVDVARTLDVDALRKLMHISEKLAQLNVERFAAYSQTPDVDMAKQAMYIFAGDTYTGLDAKSLDEDDVLYAQDNLRILSGLYGVLRPLDTIQAYRLEMGSKLATPRGKNLYEYWGDKIAKSLNESAEAQGTDLLINCASKEYFTAVDPKALHLKVLTPVFLERKNGTEKIVSFHAKKARGAMARFVVENRIKDAAQLKDFNAGGYEFDAEKSDDGSFVFSRDS